MAHLKYVAVREPELILLLLCFKATGKVAILKNCPGTPNMLGPIETRLTWFQGGEIKSCPQKKVKLGGFICFCYY